MVTDASAIPFELYVKSATFVNLPIKLTEFIYILLKQKFLTH
ncbi:hypothetical protein CDIMF43_290003 [Carnobacterium divergens]|nr:hypothetical protein CDIMF43_290003 [Carnobacterium divergens]